MHACPYLPIFLLKSAHIYVLCGNILMAVYISSSRQTSRIQEMLFLQKLTQSDRIPRETLLCDPGITLNSLLLGTSQTRQTMSNSL